MPSFYNAWMTINVGPLFFYYHITEQNGGYVSCLISIWQDGWRKGWQKGKDQERAWFKS
jgi:hypothetical protein